MRGLDRLKPLRGSYLMRSEYTFLYSADKQLVFMHPETFDQISIRDEMVGDSQPSCRMECQ